MIIDFGNGKVFDIEEYGIKWLSHKIPFPDVENNMQAVSGRNGNILVNSRLTERVINTTLLYEVTDIQDFYLLRNELYGAFHNNTPFYVTYKLEPYQRWLVKLGEGFLLPPHYSMESFEIDFLCVNLYAESIADTTTLKEWDIDKWAWNGQIDWDNPNDVNYVFDVNSFTYVNRGTVVLDPRELDMRIRIKGVGSYVQIMNVTTGDTFRYNGALTANDELVIDNINVRKNGVSVFGDTNKRVLTFAVGDNRILFTGLGDFEIAFENKFYFI